MTTVLLDALVPIFVGLLLGYLAGRRGVMDNVNVRNLIVFVMNFAIPCALFSTIIRTSREDLDQQIPTALMITLVFTVLYTAGCLCARRSLKMSVSDASVLALTIGFPNSAAVCSASVCDIVWSGIQCHSSAFHRCGCHYYLPTYSGSS